MLGNGKLRLRSFQMVWVCTNILYLHPTPNQSLFHRVQLDPLEKDWLRSSALGNMAAQRQLLSQDSSLVMKKVTHRCCFNSVTTTLQRNK